MAHDPFPRDRLAATLRRVPAYARLAWRLARDPLLSRARRAAVVGAAAYLVSPVDLVPGVIPVLGQLDDLAVAIAALRFALAGLDGERRRGHLHAVGLGDDVLGEDARAVAATTAWLVRAGARTTGRAARKGGSVAASGARAAGRATAKAAPAAAKSAAAKAGPAARSAATTAGPAAKSAAAKAGPAARQAVTRAGPAVKSAAAKAAPAAKSGAAKAADGIGSLRSGVSRLGSAMGAGSGRAPAIRVSIRRPAALGPGVPADGAAEERLDVEPDEGPG